MPVVTVVRHASRKSKRDESKVMMNASEGKWNLVASPTFNASFGPQSHHIYHHQPHHQPHPPKAKLYNRERSTNF